MSFRDQWDEVFEDYGSVIIFLTGVAGVGLGLLATQTILAAVTVSPLVSLFIGIGVTLPIAGAFMIGLPAAAIGFMVGVYKFLDFITTRSSKKSKAKSKDQVKNSKIPSQENINKKQEAKVEIKQNSKDRSNLKNLNNSRK